METSRNNHFAIEKIKGMQRGMNSKQAKQINFPDLLSRLGHEPVKITKGGRELWYASPFRKEKTASFHTSYLGGKWIWKDFGDTGGNVIDFVMRYEGIQFKEALAFLREIYQGSLFDHIGRTGHSFRQSSNALSFQQQEQDFTHTNHRELEFLEAYEIRNPVIISYLEEQRKIPADLARLYLKEVKYRNISKDKIFFAVGMENQSGGYEIRSASDQYVFKSALIKRDISVIRGREPANKTVSVFEGMVDFLSLLVLQNTDRLEGYAIIMHSVSTFKRTVQFIEGQGYELILTFLDNDGTGEEYSAKYSEAFATKIQSQSGIFEPHIDLNEALVGNKQMNPLIFTIP